MAWACGKPPLRVQPIKAGLRIDVQTLGEYQTSIDRMRLTCGEHLRWEVKASTADAQIHGFDLVLGSNACFPGDVTVTKYHVIAPDGCRQFSIYQGEQCVLELWGNHSETSRAHAILKF